MGDFGITAGFRFPYLYYGSWASLAGVTGTGFLTH